MIDLVRQREREMAIGINVQDEDSAFSLTLVLGNRYAPDVVWTVQLIHDMFVERGDLRNAVGRENRLSIRATIGEERVWLRTARNRIGKIASYNGSCDVSAGRRKNIVVIIRGIVVVFVALAVCCVLANLEMELFFLNDFIDRGECEWGERLCDRGEGGWDEPLFHCSNGACSGWKTMFGSSSGESRSSGLPVNKPIDGRTVEVGARGNAARAGSRQHGNVFGNRKLRRETARR